MQWALPRSKHHLLQFLILSSSQNPEPTLAGQDVAIADGAAQFVRWALPSIPSMTVGQCTARYLMMQGYVFPTSVRLT